MSSAPTPGSVRVLVADAVPARRRSLAEALSVERDLDVLDPVGTAVALLEADGAADVVLLVGALPPSDDPVAAVSALREAAARSGSRSGWVVLVPTDAAGADDLGRLVDGVLAAGARGCLPESSTPLQIAAAVRAAAGRAEGGPEPEAETAGAVTGPLVQRTPRERPALSRRELEVLALVAEGLTNQAVAARLYLSVSSVKSHLAHAYGRLGVTRRDAAVAEARRQGLLR